MTPEEAVEKIREIGDMIDEIPDEVQEKAPDFFESVSEGLAGVEETILDSDVVTERQAQAILNWEAGVSKWLHF